mgnify:CR=1 FL=1
MARKRNRRAPGEGAVYERPERGTWVAALIVGFDERGQPLRRTKTTRTKGEAQAWLLEQQAALHGGAQLGDNSTFQELVDAWLEAGETLRGWKSSTTSSYKWVLQRATPHLGTLRARDIEPSTIQRLLLTLARGGASPGLVRRVRLHVGMVLRDAAKKGLVPRDPVAVIDPPKVDAPAIQRWSEDEIGKVVRHCLSVDDQAARYTLVALGTGLRTEELLGLAWSSVDLTGKAITVERVAVEVEGRVELRAGGKTDAASRVVPIDDITMGALARQREHVERLKAIRADVNARQAALGRESPHWEDLDAVFPTSTGTIWGRSSLRGQFNALQKAAGVNQIKLYATRSTHGSLLADAGVNLHALAERLGHTDPRFTAKVYLRGSNSTHRAVADRIGAILGSSLVAEGTSFRVPTAPSDASSGVEPS